MDLATAMERLEAAGTEQNRTVFPRHGVTEPMFGVSYADLGRLQKEIKVDHALARELWATGNHDARILATKVADPSAMTAKEADAWARDCGNYIEMEAVGTSSPARRSRRRARTRGVTGRASGSPAPGGWSPRGSRMTERWRTSRVRISSR